MRIELNNKLRPIFEIDANNYNLIVLFDTGAFMNVYTGSVESLKLLFPDVYDSGKYTLIGEFGGSKLIKCKVYIIPEFILKGTTFHNVPVSVQPNNNIYADFILASCIIQKWKFSIDYVNQYLEIECDRSDVYVKYRTHESDKNLIVDYFVFTQ